MANVDRRKKEKVKYPCTDAEMEEVSVGMGRGIKDREQYEYYLYGWADCWKYVKAKIKKDQP